jgi:hypothetical protein
MTARAIASITEDEVLAELMAEHVAIKKHLGNSTRQMGAANDVWDQVVDLVRRWSEKTEIGVGRFIRLSPLHILHCGVLRVVRQCTRKWPRLANGESRP